MTILDEIDPAVFESLTPEEKERLIAEAERQRRGEAPLLQGTAARTHIAANYPNLPAPTPQSLPRQQLQPGEIVTYSTRGPGRFGQDTDVAVETPSGGTAYAPGNAENVTVGKGPVYVPPDPGVQEFQQRMSQVPIRNMRDAQAATEMAIRFQAGRAFQKDLDAGTPQHIAFARWGPMMMGSSRNTMSGYASAVKALSPQGQQPRPVWNPGGNGQPAHWVTPTGSVVQVRPPETVYETETEKWPEQEAKPEIPAQPAVEGGLFTKAKPAIPAQPAVPYRPERTVARKVPRTPLSQQAQGGKPITTEAALGFLRQANGDKAKARQLARDAGYEF